jgi:hypothetical protein
LIALTKQPYTGIARKNYAISITCARYFIVKGGKQHRIINSNNKYWMPVMTTKYISNLVTRIEIGETVFITHETSSAIVVEAVLLGTYVSSQSIRVGILVNGEREDIESLGIMRLADEKVITDQPTVIIPGIELMVPTNKRKRAVGYKGASLCVSADRSIWTIARGALVEQKWIQHCRRITSPRSMVGGAL